MKYGYFRHFDHFKFSWFCAKIEKKLDKNKIIDKSVNCEVRNIQCVHIHREREREWENEERHSSFMWCYGSAHVLNGIILCRRLLLCEKRFGQANTMSRSTFSVLVLKELIEFYEMLLFCFSVVTDATFCFRNGFLHTCDKCNTLWFGSRTMITMHTFGERVAMKWMQATNHSEYTAM